MTEEDKERGIPAETSGTIWDRFLASLIHAAPAAPTIAAAVTIVAYSKQATPFFAWPGITDNELADGFFNLVIAVLGLSLLDLLLGFSANDRANATSYQMLRSRLDDLKSKCFRDPSFAQAGDAGLPEKPGWRGTLAVIGWKQYQNTKEKCFEDNVKSIENALRKQGPQWVSGQAYIDLWRRAHRADEAWLYLAPLEEVNANLSDAYLSVRGSEMENKKELLAELDSVRKDLKDSEAEASRQLAVIKAAKPGNPAPQGPAQAIISLEGKARANLSRVWHAIHIYRDDRWDGFRQARNQLALAMFLISLTLYGVLWLILTIVPGQLAIIQWAVAVYLVGATIGFFSNVYAQSKISTVSDDYGLSQVRMLAAPGISGFAALAGIALGSAATGGLTEANNVAWMNALDFTQHPENLVFAAVLGLTPSLLFDRIKQWEKAMGELRSTQPAEGKKED